MRWAQTLCCDDEIIIFVVYVWFTANIINMFSKREPHAETQPQLLVREKFANQIRREQRNRIMAEARKEYIKYHKDERYYNQMDELFYEEMLKEI